MLSGRFQPGKSGNPGGRPKQVGRVKELARVHTEEALTTLAAIMRDEKSPAAARVKAAECLLDRGWGRPTQPLAGDPEEPPIGVEISQEERRRRAIEEINEAFPERVRAE